MPDFKSGVRTLADQFAAKFSILKRNESIEIDTVELDQMRIQPVPCVNRRVFSSGMISPTRRRATALIAFTVAS